MHPAPARASTTAIPAWFRAAGCCSKPALRSTAWWGWCWLFPSSAICFAPWRKDASYDSWVSLGSTNAFPVGETRLASYKNPAMNSWDGQTDNVACYVRNQGGNQFQVFAINCAHLGCPVRWFPQSQLFMCPCHGGVYYADGSRAAGPPERGLFTYNWKLVSGELQIDAGQMPTLSNTAKLVKISVGPGDCSCRG